MNELERIESMLIDVLAIVRRLESLIPQQEAAKVPLGKDGEPMPQRSADSSDRLTHKGLKEPLGRSPR